MTTRLASAVVAVVLAVGAGVATYTIQDHGPVEVTAVAKEIFDDSELNVVGV